MTSTTSTAKLKWPMSNLELKERLSRESVPLQELVHIWLQMDRNAATRRQIEELANDPSKADYLHDILASRIQFGTAGIQY